MKDLSGVDAGGYRHDLAYIHDVGFGQFAVHAAPVLIHLLRQDGKKGGLVVELGCGSGILARAVVEAGFDVLGIDLSRAMIDLARQRVPRGQFRCGSIFSTPIPPCRAVTAIGEVVCFLFDPGHSERKLLKLFRRVFEALEPGGFFLFDIAGPGRAGGTGTQKKFVEGKDWAVLVTAEEEKQKRILTRRITSFVQIGELFRRDFEVHRLRLLRPADLAKQLRSLGFRVRRLTSYGPLKFPPGYVSFLARKP